MLLNTWVVEAASAPSPVPCPNRPTHRRPPLRARRPPRCAAAPPAAPPAPAPPAPAALRRRAPSSERPPAPWGNFPLGELCTLAGIILMIVGFASSSTQALFVGLALVALSAVELVAREHFAGFRSHSA